MNFKKNFCAIIFSFLISFFMIFCPKGECQFASIGLLWAGVFFIFICFYLLFFVIPTFHLVYNFFVNSSHRWIKAFFIYLIAITVQLAIFALFSVLVTKSNTWLSIFIDFYPGVLVISVVVFLILSINFSDLLTKITSKQSNQ